jgi:hypothetical protein
MPAACGTNPLQGVEEQGRDRCVPRDNQLETNHNGWSTVV